MVVDSHNVEFGYEVLSAIPYAYELYLEGKLTETKSGFDTEALYYFSPKHTINNYVRGWHNINKARRAGLPYTFIHKPEQPNKKFPPYKEIYANDEYKFKKPTLCICNRKNKEWNVAAINYFSDEVLDELFTMLKKKYEIIYFPIALPKQFQDNVAPMPQNDIELAQKHGVKLFTDLCEGKSWNETLLKVFANCEKYITMNGGYSILASLFSGTNIVYSKVGQVQCKEIQNDSFWRWYPNLNNVRTLHVSTYEELLDHVDFIYKKEMPCVSVLIRTHRKNYFNACLRTLKSQDYKNINVVAICDNSHSIEYTRGSNARLITVNKRTVTEKKPNKQFYGKEFPYNKYLDEAQRLVNGYIVMLDDDDCFKRNDSVSTIVKNMSKKNLLIWKVDFNEAGIKPSFSFKRNIQLYDITGIGFCYHSDYVKNTDWSEWKRADYRTAKKLSEKLKIKWLDEILTGLQDKPHAGASLDLNQRDINTIEVSLKYPDGRIVKQLFDKIIYEQCKSHYESQGICLELTN